MKTRTTMPIAMRGSAAGNIITLLLILGLLGLGAYLWLGKKPAET